MPFPAVAMVFGKPFLRLCVMADAGELAGECFRWRLALQKCAAAHGKRRRGDQRRSCPAVGNRWRARNRHGKRRKDQLLGFGRQRPQAQAQALGERRRHEALCRAHKKRVTIHVAQLPQHAADRRTLQTKTGGGLGNAPFPQQRIEDHEQAQLVWTVQFSRAVFAVRF